MRDACRHGHPYIAGSFRWNTDGTRRCKECERTRQARRFVLVPPPLPETELHEATARMLDLMLLRPAQWTTMPMGHFPLPPRFAQKMLRLGAAPGWPDLLFVFDRRVFGIELKPDHGRLSETRLVRTRRGSLREVVGQVERFAGLEAAGMRIGVCRSVADVMTQLREWGLPLRNVRAAA